MSRTAEIRALAARDPRAARESLAGLLQDLFGLEVAALEINADQYSLNSLNGFFSCHLGECFFKFHQEEGEEAMRGEYYRAGLLANAGLPVDQPLLISTLPGEQILVYQRRQDPRFADVLLALDKAPDPAAEARALKAEADLNDQILKVAIETLHPITPEQSRAEPVHRLFHERLIDPNSGSYPGGRLASFYIGQTFDLPGLSATWEQIAHARPHINGQAYRHTLAELFDLAHIRLNPEHLADAGGFTAHGDAHNANVWYGRGQGKADEGDQLTFFDPAFAGDHVPSLLAEVKPSFHNSLAHPFWLYDSALTQTRAKANVSLVGDALHIDTDWQISPLREALLMVKADHFWRPWIAHLKAKSMLPSDWEDVIRLGLFLCPTMVMNLRASAGRHTPLSSAIGLTLAITMGSRPMMGQDLISRFFDRIRS